MTESQLFTLVIATIKAQLTALAVITPTYPLAVRQAFQPNLVGAPKGPAVLLHLVGQRRYGWLERKDEWIEAVPPLPGIMRHTESQQMQVTLQANALIGPPAPPGVKPQVAPLYTAGDLLGWTSAALQSDKGLQQLRDGGVGIERITDIRTPYFKDETDQFEASPSFDFTLDFKWAIITDTPIITATEIQIVPI